MARWTYSLDELPAGMGDKVGLKCANLGDLKKAGFRVPNGFVISLQAYDEFLRQSGVFDEIQKYFQEFNADPNKPSDVTRYEEAADTIRELVETRGMPAELEREINDRYTSLCSSKCMNDLPVATRSAGPASHPGQYETFLHVSGKAGVVQHVIRVWASTFNQRSLINRHRLGLPLHFDPIGVAVIEMILAKAAGVMFTANPINGDPSKIMIEANWGLGESVVSGAVTPDKWMIDKVTFEIVQTEISPKLTEYGLDPSSGKVSFLDVSKERRNIPCLTEDEVLELAKIGKMIERHFGMAQDIEWAVETNQAFPESIFFLQTRKAQIQEQDAAKPILGSKRTVFDFITDVAISGKL